MHAYAADHDGRIVTGPASPFPIAPDHAWAEVVSNWGWIGDAGQPNAHGALLADGYLDNPAAMFCPGTNHPAVYDFEFENLRAADTDVESGHLFRGVAHTTRDHLADLGTNAVDADARALFVDVNRYGPTFRPDRVATNHAARYANVGYVDGHAQRLDNAGHWFSALEQHYDPLPDALPARLAQMTTTMGHVEHSDSDTAPVAP